MKAAFVGLALAGVLAGCLGPRDPLADLHPVLWAENGFVSFHTCRWPAGGLPVGVEGEPSAEETADLERALAAWSGAGLGVRLQLAEAGAQMQPALTVRFVEDPPTRDAGALGIAIALADCRRRGDGRLSLERASVELSRQVGPDWRGQLRPIGPDERLGVLVHELGHALGFAGHVRAGEGPLVAAPEAIRRVGRRVRQGGRLDAPGLRALYALPSGHRLRQVAVATWRTEMVDTFLPLAAGAGLAGPWLRSGDRHARIFWRGADGEPLGLLVPQLPRVLEDPEALVVIPDPALRTWVEAGGG